MSAEFMGGRQGGSDALCISLGPFGIFDVLPMHMWPTVEAAFNDVIELIRWQIVTQ